MPAPPNGPRLRLEPLEDRRLLTADGTLPDPFVVTGTDANDVITLTRVNDYRVEVAVQSFRDAGWTQPLGEPVRSEIRPTMGWLNNSGLCVSHLTTGTIQVDAGAGHDRIEVVDTVGGGLYVSGTNRTPPKPADDTWIDGTPTDEHGGRWASAGYPVNAVTLIGGVDMPAGAAVGVRFQANAMPLPIPDCPDDNSIGPEDNAAVEASPDGFPAGIARTPLLGGQEDGWSGTDFDAGSSGDGGPAWRSDDSSLSDLWTQAGDSLWLDGSEGETGSSPGGSDTWAGDGMDGWLITDLES